MFGVFNTKNAGKPPTIGSNEELERLLQGPSALEKVLSFQGLIAELPFALNAHCFFTTDRIVCLMDLVFRRSVLQKYSFEDSRKLAFVSSELLSAKVPVLMDFFMVKESPSADKQTTQTTPHNGCSSEKTEKDLLLSPTNSDRSRALLPKETFRKQAFQQLLDSALSRDDIDETRAGYLVKVLQFYFRKDRNEFLETFFDESLQCNRFLDFLDFHSLTDFLGQLFMCSDNNPSDSMIIQDAGQPVDSRLNSLRADFMLRLLTTNSLTRNFETASNIRLLAGVFFDKWGSQAEGLATVGRLFDQFGFIGHLHKALVDSDEPSILYEVLLTAKAVSVLLVCPVSSREGDGEQRLDSPEQPCQQLAFGTDCRRQTRDLLTHLKGLMAVGHLETVFANRFNRKDKGCPVKFKVVVLDILGNLLSQKSIEASESFEDRQFLGDFMVS
jgi:hypothetical protein